MVNTSCAQATCFTLSQSADIFIAFFIDNFAGFFICKNNIDGSFQRAGAILSRTKSLSVENYSLVKENFHDYGIQDEDLTIVVTCD
jgi:hypothetical protein